MKLYRRVPKNNKKLYFVLNIFPLNFKKLLKTIEIYKKILQETTIFWTLIQHFTINYKFLQKIIIRTYFNLLYFIAKIHLHLSDTKICFSLKLFSNLDPEEVIWEYDLIFLILYGQHDKISIIYLIMNHLDLDHTNIYIKIHTCIFFMFFHFSQGTGQK